MEWKTPESLTFDNSYHRLPSALYTAQEPTPLPEPQTLSINPEVAKWLELDPCSLSPERVANWLGGHWQAPGSQSLAMKYTGHQFGIYNPELGDGRGLLLGEVITSDGQRLDLHLKGAGKTPYSRFGDGRAVVRSTIREYLVGEALHGLGIPSTRALALIASPEPVRRETWEPAASLLRVTPCHIRFGHFEYCYHTGDKQLLSDFSQYCLERFFPEAMDSADPVAAMFIQVCEKSAHMVAGWQAYGFLHGVLNTDNMSLIGETFDHGPFAFIDRWHPLSVYNHTDESGRYAFGQQPSIVRWNLQCLAKALSPLTTEAALEESINHYTETFQQAYAQKLKQRLGLYDNQEEDIQLLQSWLNNLKKSKTDFQRLYRLMSESINETTGHIDRSMLSDWEKDFGGWLNDYEQRLVSAPDRLRREKMLNTNPAYLLRTHIAQHIIDQVHSGNNTPLAHWLEKLQSPYDRPIMEEEDFLYAPEEAEPPSLSCSS